MILNQIRKDGMEHALDLICVIQFVPIILKYKLNIFEIKYFEDGTSI